MCFSKPNIKTPPPLVEPPVEDEPGDVLIADEAAAKRGSRVKSSGRRALTIGLKVPKASSSIGTAYS